MKNNNQSYKLFNAIKLGGLALILTGLLTNCADSQSLGVKESSTLMYEEGKAGMVTVTTAEVTAVVRDIDITLRTLTLDTEDGEEINIRVGPEAVNFDKIKVKDKVRATVAEEMIVSVNETGEKISENYESLVMLATENAKKPAGLVAETTIVTADVVAIDQKKRTATLKFSDGEEKTVSVREDIDLSQHKVGDQVVFQITEMVAIDVVKVP